MPSSNGKKPPVPADICGYPVDTALAPDATSFLAIGPGGRGVVLKELDPDCLLKGKGTLHPSIKDRLARVRELALAGVSNLYGVERDPAQGKQAWMIWEFVQGQTFDQFATESGCTPRQLALCARELVLTVDSLHMQGIVHGAIKGSNVIVLPGGGVRLTHVSPLLWSDPAEDMRAVIEMLRHALQERKEERSPLGRVLNESTETLDGAASLRPLGAKLAVIIDNRETPARAAQQQASQERAPRRRSLLAAALVLLLALAGAYALWHVVGDPPVKWPQVMEKVRAVVK